MMDAKCFICGHVLNWLNDEYDGDAVDDYGEKTTVVTSSYECPDCGAMYMVTRTVK